MQPHDREEYRGQMGHVWLGFSEPQIGRLLAGAGFDGTRVVPLSPAPGVRGPALFVARATAGKSSLSERTLVWRVGAAPRAALTPSGAAGGTRPTFS